MFARAVVAGASHAEAYRQSYNTKTTNEQTVFQEGSRVAARPQVAARIRELKDLAAAATVVDAAWVLGQWVAIASANPNDVISYQRVNCRHCRGQDRAYQWRDADEWADAMAAAIKREEPPPDASGGYGFNPTLEPVPDCPRCFGEGVERVHITDTRRLSGPARRLYAGVKQTPRGLEVKLRDQDGALLNIAKHLGMLDLKVTGELDLKHGAVLTDEQRAALREMLKGV